MELEADLVVFNGNIVTMDPQNPRVTAIAVKSYKILAMGDDEQLFHLVPNATRVIDLGGKTVVPGFVDAHTHLTSDGIRASHIKLHSAESLEDALEILKEALPNYRTGEWVLSYGWDESQWPQKRYLNARDLDKVSKKHPIFATRIDGHLVSVNSFGFEKLGIPLELEGVMKTKSGAPTGVLKDVGGVHDKIRPDSEAVREGVVAGNRMANELGITAAVDNAVAGMLKHVRDVEQNNNLSVRMVINPPVEQMNHMIKLGLTSGMGSPLVKIGGVKIFTDGSIGAATAAVSKPYEGQKSNKGMLLVDKNKYSRIVKKAVNNDIQTVTHAIGDAAIEMVIETFEGLSESMRAKIRDQRHRIEHAELINEWQIRRAVGLGLILSMQPNFVAKWQLEGGLYEHRFDEERVRGMNMFRVALDNGARLCFGSDGMPYGPLYGIWAATTHPNPRVVLTVEEALRCYTLESAYSSFIERTVGSLAIGKRADFVVLSDDIMSVPPEAIKDIEVEMTIVGGIIEYSSLGT
ncbi:MAG: amidohydrolase [Candidatus Thorarchaeota archaeon]